MFDIFPKNTFFKKSPLKQIIFICEIKEAIFKTIVFIFFFLQ